MTPQLPSIRTELPFAASGPLHRVHVSAAPLLDAFLERHGYARVEVDGARMGGRVAMHAELARAMDFPDWYGANWDAFNDCFGGFLHERRGSIVAVVVHNAELMDPSSALELGVCAFGMEERFLEATPFHVFAIGTSTDYGRPD